MNRSRAYSTLMLISIWRNKANLELTCTAKEAFTLIFEGMTPGVTLFSVNRQLTQKKCRIK